ncbi:MAG: TonB-dependent receptor [Deltaproteobacteria bacterium]|nr:TonB-dependent receptor [Deltaproteobacteria bacterium]
MSICALIILMGKETRAFENDGNKTEQKSTYGHHKKNKSINKKHGLKKKIEPGLIILPPTVVRGKRIRPAEAGTGFGETIFVDKSAGGLKSAADVLSDAAGVQVRKLGGTGSFGFASIRGSTPGQVTVYLDGVKINAGGFSSVDLSQFPLDILESMDVYKGKSPMSMSFSGLGGVIVLNTRRLRHPMTRVSIGYGSWSTARLGALRAEKAGDADLLAVLSMETSLGDFEYLNWNGTWLNQEDDRIQRRRNNQHLSVSGLFKLGWKGLGWTWTVMNDLFTRHQGVAGIGSVPTNKADLSNLRDTLSFHASRPIFGRSCTLKLVLDYLALRESFNDPQNEIGIGAQETRSASDSLHAAVMLTLGGIMKHLLTARIDAGWEGFHHEEILSKVDSSLKQRFRLALSLQDEWKLLPMLILNPGARIEGYFAWFGGGPVPGRPTEVIDDRSLKKPFWEASLGGKYVPVKWLALKANAGRFTRPPDITELFGDRGAVVGNADLSAETGYNMDLGLALDLKARNSRVHFFIESAGFASFTDNLIAYVQSSQSTIRPENVDSARTAGLELRLKLALWNTIFLSSNYTYLDARNSSSSPKYNGKRLPGRPVHEAYAKLKIKLTDRKWIVRIWTDLDYAGDNYLDQLNLKHDPVSRLLFGAGLQFVWLKKGISLTLEASNILDTIVLYDRHGRKYPLRDFEAFPLPGRTLMATLKAGL